MNDYAGLIEQLKIDTHSPGCNFFGVSDYGCDCTLFARRKAASALTTLTQQRVTALEALKDARQFIRNGAEFGYIRMPHEPDAGVHTLPRIEAAIAAMEGKADE